VYFFNNGNEPQYLYFYFLQQLKKKREKIEGLNKMKSKLLNEVDEIIKSETAIADNIAELLKRRAEIDAELKDCEINLKEFSESKRTKSNKIKELEQQINLLEGTPTGSSTAEKKGEVERSAKAKAEAERIAKEKAAKVFHLTVLFL